MKPESFTVFASFLRNNSGLSLTPAQDYLLSARLSSLLEIYGCLDLDALAAQVAAADDPRLLRHVAEAMATHETSFFRDPKIFALLRETILPDCLRRNERTKTLRVWSAGCATGQEPYSVAMTILDVPAFDGWTVEILGTDLSEEALRRARNGVYTHYEVQRGLSIAQLVKYFRDGGDRWQASEKLRRAVSFAHGNLLNDAPDGSFDIVLCRNVLIYVDDDAKRRIDARLEKSVKPQGWLILGAIETRPPDPQWAQTAPGVFKRV